MSIDTGLLHRDFVTWRYCGY